MSEDKEAAKIRERIREGKASDEEVRLLALYERGDLQALSPEAVLAWATFKTEFMRDLEPKLLRIAEWFERQIRRSPRLHRWLS